MVLSTEIWTQETINGSTTSTRHLQFEEDLGSIWRSRKTRNMTNFYISSKRLFIPGMPRDTFTFFLLVSGYSWCLLIFGTILMVQLVLSFLELKPPFSSLPLHLQGVHHDTCFLQKYTHPLWPEQSGQMPTCCLTAYHSPNRLVGFLASSQKMEPVASTMSFKIGSEPRSASKTPRNDEMDRFWGGFKKMTTWLHRVGSSAADWSRSWRA